MILPKLSGAGVISSLFDNFCEFVLAFSLLLLEHVTTDKTRAGGKSEKGKID